MEEARDLIEQSAQMVEQARRPHCSEVGRSCRNGTRHARANSRPCWTKLANARRKCRLKRCRKAVEVRASIEKGIEELVAAARRTAEETAAIDRAFQDRVRRNYDALSEAAAAMGGPAPARPPQPSMTRSKAAPVAPPPIAPPSTPEMDDDLLADEPGQRPRLRLTPTATDDEFRSVFDTAGGRGGPASPEGADGQNWSWRSLLSGIENSSPGDAALGEKLAAEISAMGNRPACPVAAWPDRRDRRRHPDSRRFWSA